MKPDAIFFLSDGLFDPSTARVLRLRNRGKATRIPIHTIAFVNQENERIMKTIASDSGGDYRYVPYAQAGGTLFRSGGHLFADFSARLKPFVDRADVHRHRGQHQHNAHPEPPLVMNLLRPVVFAVLIVVRMMVLLRHADGT